MFERSNLVMFVFNQSSVLYFLVLFLVFMILKFYLIYLLCTIRSMRPRKRRHCGNGIGEHRVDKVEREKRDKPEKTVKIGCWMGSIGAKYGLDLRWILVRRMHRKIGVCV